MTATRTCVCDRCIDAACDEAAMFGDGDLDRETAVQLAIGLGADIADHLCDWRDGHTSTRCTCACNARG